MEKFEPLFDRLLVTESKSQTNENGIYIPPSGKERSFIMHVTAIGNDVKQIKVGQRVLIAKYAGVETPGDVGGFVIRESDVLGVVS